MSNPLTLPGQCFLVKLQFPVKKSVITPRIMLTFMSVNLSWQTLIRKVLDAIFQPRDTFKKVVSAILRLITSLWGSLLSTHRSSSLRGYHEHEVMLPTGVLRMGIATDFLFSLLYSQLSEQVNDAP